MIFTSYFRSPVLKSNPQLKRVAISIGVPPGWKGERCLELAPTRAMLKMASAEYYRLYDDILAKLDAREIGRRFDGCVLICWEKNPAECHRSYVVKWLNNAGFEAQELTAGRQEVGQQTLNL